MPTEPGSFPRSFLYVPGTRSDLFHKAAGSGADAVIVDLEDATPLSGRAEARAQVATWLQGREAAGDERSADVWVRVDPATDFEDLDAVMGPRLSGIVLAKCSRNSLRRLSEWADANGASEVPVVGLIETAATFLEMPAIAQEQQVVTFGIGEVDLLGDLGMTRSHRTAGAVDALRTQVVLHCAAAGLRPPIAPTSTEFRDLEGFRESTRLMLELGFRSRTAVHPGQVPVINEVLTPTAEELEAARDLLARYDASEAGVTVDAAGHLIDAAVIRHARDVISRGHDARD